MPHAPGSRATQRAGWGRELNRSWGFIGVQIFYRRRQGKREGTGAPWRNKRCGRAAQGGEGAVGAATMGRDRRVAGGGMSGGDKNTNRGKGYVAELGAPGGGASPDSWDRRARTPRSPAAGPRGAAQRGDPGRVAGTAGGRAAGGGGPAGPPQSPERRRGPGTDTHTHARTPRCGPRRAGASPSSFMYSSKPLLSTKRHLPTSCWMEAMVRAESSGTGLERSKV